MRNAAPTESRRRFRGCPLGRNGDGAQREISESVLVDPVARTASRCRERVVRGIGHIGPGDDERSARAARTGVRSLVDGRGWTRADRTDLIIGQVAGGGVGCGRGSDADGQDVRSEDVALKRHLYLDHGRTVDGEASREGEPRARDIRRREEVDGATEIGSVFCEDRGRVYRSAVPKDVHAVERVRRRGRRVVGRHGAIELEQDASELAAAGDGHAQEGEGAAPEEHRIRHFLERDRERASACHERVARGRRGRRGAGRGRSRAGTTDALEAEGDAVAGHRSASSRTDRRARHERRETRAQLERLLDVAIQDGHATRQRDVDARVCAGDRRSDFLAADEDGDVVVGGGITCEGDARLLENDVLAGGGDRSARDELERAVGNDDAGGTGGIELDDDVAGWSNGNAEHGIFSRCTGFTHGFRGDVHGHGAHVHTESLDVDDVRDADRDELARRIVERAVEVAADAETQLPHRRNEHRKTGERHATGSIRDGCCRDAGVRIVVQRAVLHHACEVARAEGARDVGLTGEGQRGNTCVRITRDRK